jgi:hypothetical protein
MNIKLHTGSNALIHNNFFYDSWVSTFVREDCIDCYTSDKVGTETFCKNTNGA